MRAKLATLIAFVLLCSTAPVAAGDVPFTGWEVFDTASGLPSNKVFAVLVEGPRVWAGTEEGLALLENDAVRVFGTADGLPFPAVTALAVSENGDLWIGTMGGLARLTGGRFDVFTQVNSGLANNVVYGISVDGPNVWVATAAGLSRYDTRTGGWAIFDTTNTLMHEPWTYSVLAERGAVYVAVWGGGVIVRDRVTGQFREHRDPDGEMEIDLFRDDGLVHDVTSAIGVSGDLMWVGTYFGLSRYDGRRWKSYSQMDSGLAGDFINFVVARDDLVWIATDQGMSRFDGQTWHTWRRLPGRSFELQIDGPDGERRTRRQTSGLPSNTVFCIGLAGDDVWVATAAGLAHGIAADSNPSIKPNK
ncbi:MAG: regulator [Acidobacteriota bacterium]|nr:regulator [Acidobacteriota bacterium]